MKYNKIQRLLTIALFFAISCSVQGQVVLYFEKLKDVEPEKIYEGQHIHVKLKDYPNEWNTIRIDRILKEENVIFYDGGMFNIEEITHIRMKRGWVSGMSVSLTTFGTVWLAYGGIAHFAVGNFDFGVDTAVIGGGSLLIGWLLRKFFKWKKYKIGKKNRLKILDLSWPTPVGGFTTA